MLGSYPRTKSIRQERRARAEIVQAKSASLTPQERLAKLDQAGLKATKEREKLAKKLRRAQIEAQNPSKKKELSR